MSAQIIHWVSGVASTVGAVGATIRLVDLASAADWPDGQTHDNCVLSIDAWIVGRNTSGAVAAGGAVNISRAFKRVSGTVTAIDAAIITLVNGTLQVGLLGSVFDIDISGTTIRLRATGIAANTIEWFGDMRIRLT